MEILRKRSDGYHDLNTVFYRLSEPNDILTVSPSECYTLKIDSKTVLADQNLITKAISACAKYKGIAMPNLHIKLEKHIPIGAGLGGGSANAAKAIEIFSQQVSVLTNTEQHTIGASIGADVSFFLQYNIASTATGIGDKLTPIELQLPYYFLIVKPKTISISTQEAYSKVTVNERRPTDLAEILRKPLDVWKNNIINDFEGVAFVMHPELERIKSLLYQSGAGFALMSGSGSAFFAVYSQKETADTAMLELGKNSNIEVFLSSQLQ